MPNDSPEDNRVYCKAYYDRLKQDPAKWRAMQRKKAEAQKLRRSKHRAQPCGFTVASPVNPPVASGSQEAQTVTSTPRLGGKHEAPPTAYWAAGMTQEQIIEVYREHQDKQEADQPSNLKEFLAMLDT